MPITLITGPPNAGKANIVMEAVRKHVARGEEPLLVLPTRADVEHYRRELAEGGLVMGVRVERFGGLTAEVLRRSGWVKAALSPLARERILAGICTLSVLGGTRKTPGYVRALAAFAAELEGELITPARLRSALERWAAGEQARVRRAEEICVCFEEYQRVLDGIGRIDPGRRIAGALEELRRAPRLWGPTPVLLYGFDDFSKLQLDAIETLGTRVDVPVTVSLAYEPGRLAFAGRTSTVQALAPLAAEHMQLQARADYYAPQSRAALHHLERSLFEPGADRAAAAGAVRLLEGGGERAELELVAGEVKALLDRGMAPEEIAIVHRSPSAVAEELTAVLESFEIPFALQRRQPFAHTAIGRALLGALRAAALPQDSGADDLLAWLRAPGLLEHHELADRLEAKVRRTGAGSLVQARSLWESEHWPLTALEHLRDAAARGMPALIDRATRELKWLFTAPRRGEAAVLEADELDEARALAAGLRALGELRELARVAPRLTGGAAELVEVLEGTQFFSGERPGPGMVAVVDPLALRARRVRALFLCGLQEGVFPANARGEPLLGEDERRLLAETSGLRLGRHEDALAVERYLLYATVSRPEELLTLSWHTASDDGAPRAMSLFVEDVCDALGEGPSSLLSKQRLRRPLGAAAWPGPGDPSPAWERREGILAQARLRPRLLAPLRDAQLIAELREGMPFSASTLETWASCPVRWFVERLLRAEDIDPHPEPFARGGLAHAALKDTLEGLRLKTGSARLTPARLGFALELLHAALQEHAEEFPLSVAAERIPGMRRRLALDLERYLEHAALAVSPLEPKYLELSFGFKDEEGGLPALDLGDGVLLRGRIDRIDVGADGEAVVYDYKGKSAPAAGKWAGEGHFQLALYMRAAEDLLGVQAVGGFYQPLAGADLRARGLLDADAGVELECVRGDSRERQEVQALLAQTLTAAREAAAQARAGALQARPDTCAFKGGCRYPTICRCER